MVILFVGTFSCLLGFCQFGLFSIVQRNSTTKYSETFNYVIFGLIGIYYMEKATHLLSHRMIIMNGLWTLFVATTTLLFVLAVYVNITFNDAET
jgi:hypothetical protein